jgi:hypothetical protein
LSTQAETNPGEQMRYRLFGHTLASDRPLSGWLPASSEAPDLILSFVTHPPVEWDPVRTAPAYISPIKSQDGKSLLSLYRLGSCEVMSFADQADYYLWPERLICHLRQAVPSHLLNVQLLSSVLPFWLELRGYVTIHASAVNLAGKAVGLIAHSRDGKSTLAAALLRDGCSLLTDDVLPLSRRVGGYWANPGYPAMRMWPDEAEHFTNHYEELERVHPDFTKRYVPVSEQDFGLFCDRPCPLGQIYILERREAAELVEGPRIKPVSNRQAVIELLRYSFVTRLSQAVGLAPDRFNFFAGLVGEVPVRRLVYPSGYEYLPQVRQAILADCLMP